MVIRRWMVLAIVGLGALAATACTQAGLEPSPTGSDSISSPAATSPPATTVALDHANMTNPCGFTAPPPTPTPGPPTPTPTPPPTSPFSEEDFPPYVELPPRPSSQLPVEAHPLADALVSISVHPPADYDRTASYATGLLVSRDGLVLTLLDYTRPVDRIEVVLPDGATREASIERVDARTGATLLEIEGSNLPYAEIGDGNHSVSPGEPVLLLRRFPDGGELFIREGFAAPATNEGAQETLFALLPIRSRGGNSDLVVNREGKLLGLAGPGQWLGAGPFVSGPPPGPPQPAVKTSSLVSLIEGRVAKDASAFPVAVSYHGQGWTGLIDSLVTRELLAGPARETMGGLDGPVAVKNLGQDPRAVIGYKPGTVLELVYPRPQELRSSEGELLGVARYVAFWWDREKGKPDVVLCGAEPGHAGAAFRAGDLAKLKAAAASAPASGGSMVDTAPLPDYPYDYPLKWQVRPKKEIYSPEEEVEFIVTIENLSDWPMTVYHLPPVLEVRKQNGPGPWWQSASGEPGDSSQTVPAHEELRLVIPWALVDHEGNPMPPGGYTVGAATGGVGGVKFTILEK